jgi:hypothetical protein
VEHHCFEDFLYAAMIFSIWFITEIRRMLYVQKAARDMLLGRWGVQQTDYLMKRENMD